MLSSDKNQKFYGYENKIPQQSIKNFTGIQQKKFNNVVSYLINEKLTNGQSVGLI